MKPDLQKTILTTLLLVFSLASYSETITCTLTGTIVNRKSKSLLLVKETGDLRINSQHIPIKNNAFSFTLKADVPEAYILVFEEEYGHAWIPIKFFPYNGEIRFTLYPMDEAEKNLVKGGEENRIYAEFIQMNKDLFGRRTQALNAKRDILISEHAYRSPASDSISAVLSKLDGAEQRRPIYLVMEQMRKTGTDLTEQGNLVNRAFDSLRDDRNIVRYKYIKDHPSIVSYYLVWEDMRMAKENRKISNAIADVYPALAAKYPDHLYTMRIGNELSGLIKIRPGEKFIDFTAPDLSGMDYTLSALANGKVTLVDFWGSWCGPCIAASKLMMPVYDDFKSKGFTVVGVAREFKTKNDLVDALKKYKFPWLNLVELDDARNIWNKYAISNGVGMVLLLDKDGTILAIDPTADEVRKELSRRL
ncbi:MAG: TlpA disulfide reductase family protein [Bacteroidota bacterium]